MVRQLAPDRATQVSFYRLLANPAVTVEGLLDAQADADGLGAVTGHVLALTDTTALDLRHHAGRLRPATVGPIGPGGAGLGLFLHPVLCLAADDDAPRPVLGVSSLQHWHRPAAPAAGKDRTRPLAEKESHKWLVAGQQTRRRLPLATRITLVGDREGDVYEALAGLVAEGLDFVVRSRDDRRLADPAADPADPAADRLVARLATGPEQGRYAVPVARTAATAPHPTRVATLAVRFAPVALRRPARLRPGQAAAQLPCWAVDVREVDPPAGEAPVHWRLLTTHVVADAADARRTVGYYARRWWIEQLFRVLKQQGLQVEACQLADGQAIVRLATLALPAALAVMQLALGRQQAAPQTVLDAPALACLRHLAPTLDGRTDKQRNPPPPASLAWVSWCIARLGGWSGLASQRPPGVITLTHGWQYFQRLYEGWKLAQGLVCTR